MTKKELESKVIKLEWDILELKKELSDHIKRSDVSAHKRLVYGGDSSALGV